eukprot:CAMPEP_0176092108 /NCGR_PEP_ID=MMETSP0120_2-20121206/46140_1 /TAXON_ID=160619 /ORGANISM="Kryptoperidinium foliaceum, Strain CCMP 1326" /LENGTH=252 /DNA_ID=CAMNT_0017426013 /DNA_START=42 /DNA_END=800 /DNA_ORIENTATION=-
MVAVHPTTLEAMAFDFVLMEDTARCLELASEASTVEAEAMRLDRLGGLAAADQYRRAGDLLRLAAADCPMDHPDRSVLESHAREVTTRAEYLEGLQGAAATVPLEEHIHAVTLTLGASAPPAPLARQAWHTTATDQKKVMGAAAAVAAGTGLLLLGPFSAVAMGVGAAYASSREDRTGVVVRRVGKAGVKAIRQARALDEEYRITTKALVAGQTAVDQAWRKLSGRHKVTRTLGWGVSSAGSALSGLASRLS